MPSKASLPPFNSPYPLRTSAVTVNAVSQVTEKARNPNPLLNLISVAQERTSDPHPRLSPSKPHQFDDGPGLPFLATLQIAASANDILKLYETLEARIQERYQQQFDKQKSESAAQQRETAERQKKAEEKCDSLHEQLISGVKIRSEERGKWEQERKELLRRIESMEKCMTEVDKAANVKIDAALERELSALRTTVEEERREREIERKHSAEEILRYKKENLSLKEDIEIWEVETKEVKKVLDKEKRDQQTRTELDRRACQLEQEKERKKWQEETLALVVQLEAQIKLNLRQGGGQGKEGRPRKRQKIN